MLSRFKLNLFKAVPLDLGESQVRTVDLDTNQLLVEETPANLVKSGIVINQKQLISFLDVFLQPIWHPRYLFQPTLVTAVAGHLTSVERQVLRQSLYLLGARKVILFPTALAVALGSGVNFQDSHGSLFLHLGQGVVEMSLVSLGRVSTNQTSFFAGAWLERQIKALLRKNHDVMVTTKGIEKIKKELLSFYSHKKLTVKVKKITDGKIGRLTLEATEFLPLINKLATKYVYLVESVLKRASAEVVVEAVDRGLILTGGLAVLDGLSQYLTDSLNFPVVVAEEPRLSLTWGLVQLAKDLDDFTTLSIAD